MPFFSGEGEMSREYQIGGYIFWFENCTEEQELEALNQIQSGQTSINLPVGLHMKPNQIRRKDRFDPLVLINGDPWIGEGTKIGVFSEIYDKGGVVKIGKDCDIASFVAINCADSHKRCIGESDEVEILPITIEDNVFIGTHSVVLGGCVIGHHTVIGAGLIVQKRTVIPPYSVLVNFSSVPMENRMRWKFSPSQLRIPSKKNSLKGKDGT